MTETTTDLTQQKSEVKSASRPAWGRILAWGGLIALLAIVAIGLLQAQQGPVGIGQRAPNFTLNTFEGEQISLSSLQGKVVMINFWASWCKPCEGEAPDLENAWRYYQPGGEVVFLGVDYVDTEPAALEYLQKFDVTYPNGPDLGTRISQAYRTTGVPETYIIDKSGILRYVKLSPISLDELRSAIDPLLEE
jgi:cytochrome c biogenesis protein CcmG/thiol:disulfide interchange protein DsbE